MLDLPRRVRQRTGRTADNIKKVEDLLKVNRRLTISALSYQSGVPWSTCRRIVCLDLDMVKKAAKFVPHLLNEDNMKERLRIASACLTKINFDTKFLSSVITMDESWVYCYDPELKSQSDQWVKKGERRPVKSACPRAVGKVLLVSFFDVKGIVYREYLRRTINSEIFCGILSRFRHAVARNRGVKYLKEFTLHMDNASPHTS